MANKDDNHDSDESKYGLNRRQFLEATGGASAIGAFAAPAVGSTEFSDASDSLTVTIRQITRSDFPEVDVFANVVDADAEPVTGLTANDFVLEEDGVDQTIQSVAGGDGTEPEPISISIVIDESGSMSGQRMENARESAKEFVSQFDDEDEAVILSFDTTVTDRSDGWKKDVSVLEDSIDDITAGGGTALYDATISGVVDAADREDRSAAIVLSDGEDNSSSNTVTDAIEAAQNSGVPVYTIGVGDAIAPDILEEIATETGGEYYETADSDDLSFIYNQLSQALANEYEITYETTNTETDGSERTVMLQATAQGETAQDTGVYESPCAPLPTAVLDLDPTSPTTDQEVEFDGSQSVPNGGELTRYAWDFDNNGRVDATGETVTHAYSDPGEYEARLTVEKECGARDVAVQPLEVSPVQFPIEITDTNSPIEEGEDLTVTVEITNVGSDSDVTTIRLLVDDLLDITDSPGTTENLSPGETVTETFIVETDIGDAGTYTAVGESSDSEDSTEIVLEETMQLPIDIEPSIPTAGEEITFDASQISGPVDAYHWEFGDGATETGEIVSHSYSDPGTYEIALTVERPEGTETQTEILDVGERNQQGDTGITAKFDYSPRYPGLGEDVIFDANESSGDITEYSWSFGDGEGTAGEQATHSYAETGEYEVELRVLSRPSSIQREQADDGTLVVPEDDEPQLGAQSSSISVDVSRGTINVDAGDEFEGFVVDETELTTLDRVQFDSGIDEEVLVERGLRVQWDFGDGTTAEGTTVSHQYTDAGEYDVTMTVGDVTSQKTLEVTEAPIQITGVDRRIGGTLVPNIGIEEGFDATVETGSGRTLDRVEYEFLGREETVSGGPPFVADFEIDTAATAPNETLVVRAVGSDGATHEVTQGLPTLYVPGWFDFLIDATDDIEVVDNDLVTLGYNPIGELDLGLEIDGDAFDSDDNDAAEDDDQQFDFDGVEFEASYDPLTNIAELESETGGEADFFTANVDIDFEASGEFEPQGLTEIELQGAEAIPEFTVGIIPRSLGPIPLSIPIPGTDESVGIMPEISLGIGGRFEFDGDLNFDGGEVVPGLGLEIIAGIEITLPMSDYDVGEIRAGPNGELVGAFDLATNDRDFRGEFVLSGRIVIDTPTRWFDYEAEKDVYTQTWRGGPPDGIDPLDAPHPAQLRRSSAGGSKPLPDIQSVDAVTSFGGGLDTEAVTPRESFRLSDREFDDAKPVIASTDDSQLVVWRRGVADKPASDGYDLAARWRDGNSWEDTFLLTDDRVDNVEPAVVADDDGNVLVAWRIFDTEMDLDSVTDLDDYDELRKDSEIAYRVYDGTSWSDRTILTQGDEVQRRPTVAAGADGFLVAWQSVSLDTGESSVRATTVSSTGDAGDIDERPEADLPDAGSRLDGDIDLAYIQEDSIGAREVVHEQWSNGEVSESATYDATNAVRVAVADGRVVWAVNPRYDPALYEASGGVVEELSLRDDVVEVDELSLTARGSEAILSYLSTLEDSTNRDLVYRLDRGSGWIQDRRVAGDTEEELAFRHTDVEFVDPTTFLSVYAIRDRGVDSVSDVFATEQEFAPEYTIEGEIDPGTAGESTTLSYRIENNGDTDGTEPISVDIRRDGDVVDTVTHSPLDVGEEIERERTVTIGDRGTVWLDLETTESTLSSGETTIELVAATPALRVREVRARRIATSEAVVELTIGNDGEAAAHDVPVELSDGGTSIAILEADRVGPHDETTVSAVIDPDGVDRTAEQQITIDPDGELPSRAIERRSRKTHLLQSELRLEDVRYRQDSEGPFLRVLVANAGPGAADGFLTVRNENGQTLQTIDLTVPPAIEPDTGKHEEFGRADVRVNTLAEGQTLIVALEPETSSRDADSLQQTVEVSSLLPADFSGGFPERATSVASYRNADGVVDTSGLRDAIDDWRDGRIDTDLLRDVIDAWRTG